MTALTNDGVAEGENEDGTKDGVGVGRRVG